MLKNLKRWCWSQNFSVSTEVTVSVSSIVSIVYISNSEFYESYFFCFFFFLNYHHHAWGNTLERCAFSRSLLRYSCFTFFSLTFSRFSPLVVQATSSPLSPLFLEANMQLYKWKYGWGCMKPAGTENKVDEWFWLCKFAVVHFAHISWILLCLNIFFDQGKNNYIHKVVS